MCPYPSGGTLRVFGILTTGLVLGASAAEAQTGTIAGRVTSAETGQPIPSAQVFIVELDLGVLTQANGVFNLQNVPAGTQAVTVQRLGYREATATVQVVAGATSGQDFVLIQSALELDAVVVTGTAGGSQRRAIGNVVSTLDEIPIETLPVANIQELLGERVSGVMVMGGGGDVGTAGAPIRIRGTSSTALSNDPIVYIDGVRMNTDRPYASTTSAGSRLNDLNPSDIESIEVIKGPAASTLYGTEASNGVIQIITKRGVAGAPSFDATVELGASWLAKPQEKIGPYWGTNPQTRAVIGPLNLLQMEEQRFGKTHLQYGPMQRYDLSARGGTEFVRYFASLRRSDQEGVVSWNDQRDTSGRMNLDLTPHERVNVQLSGSLMSGAVQDSNGWFTQMYSGNPSRAGDFGGIDNPLRGFYTQTPEMLRDDEIDTRNVTRSTTSGTLRVNPWDWFTARFVGGVDITGQRREVLEPFRGPNAVDSDNRVGEKTTTLDDTRLTTLDLSSTATARLMDGRLGSATSVGFQYYRRWIHSASASGEGFATPNLNVVGAAALTDASESILENITVGSYVQQQFDWNERIFLTAAVRGDDNSAFGKDFDAAIYPKVSGTWVLSEESFWNVEPLGDFRLRAAWGEAGQQPDLFAAARLFESQPGPNDEPALTPIEFGNPDLAPETGSELEVGFDASILERVGLSFTAYWKTTADAIVQQPLAESTGFPSAQFVNVGETRNWGMETELDLQILTRDPVRWDMAVAFSTMQNEITDLGGVEQIPVRRGRMHVEGYPLASIFMQKVVSARFRSGSSGAVTDILCDGGGGPDGREIGGDPVPCNQARALYWGRSEPTWSLHTSSILTLFTNWRLTTTIDARGGHTQFHDRIGAKHTSFSNTACANLLDDLMCLAQRAVNRGPLGLFDGSFVRLRELSLGYTLPDQMAARVGVDRASVNVGWRNVGLLWFPGKTSGGPDGIFQTKYPTRIPDPETNSPSEVFGGEAVSETPPLSLAVVTVRVSF